MNGQKSTHTPGPWHDSSLNSHDQGLIYKDGICIGNMTSRDSEMNAAANARLAAAAPELADALEQYMLDHLAPAKQDGEGCHCQRCIVARAALRKAGVAQ